MSSHPKRFLLALGATLSLLAPLRASAAVFDVFYGSPNDGAGNGISIGRFDSATGALTSPHLAAEAAGPSFFVLAADGRHLYACLEKAAKVAAYEISPTDHALKLLNTQLSGGAGPCHISLDQTGRFALVANYDAGSVSVLPIQADGSLGASTGFDQQAGTGPDKDRQGGPHAHGIITDPSNRFALCCDLGNDRIYVYHFDAATGKLTPNDPAFGIVAPGSGPRHPLFSKNGRVLYVINEMAATVTAFNWDAAKGTLTEFQTINTLPRSFTGMNTDAEIKLDPTGKFLYASARGHDCIAVFAIDGTGRLAFIQDVDNQGKTPRYFSFDPTGHWVISGSQGSNTVAVFRVDAGALTPVGTPVAAPAPICMQFLPAMAK